MEGAAFHSLHHPSVPSTASAWSEAQTLHVACAYSNPVRWRTRRELLLDFRRHMAASANVRLYVGELAYGDRPHEVTDAAHPLDFQWRTRHELWHKENLLNLVVQRFPADWKYGAYVDGDFHFSRHDWALEAVHLLQHYDWVQLFTTYTDLGKRQQPQSTLPGFAYAVVKGLNSRGQPIGQSGRPGSPGGAWAFRREAFDAVGGLIDFCVLGSADWHMAVGLSGKNLSHVEIDQGGREYRAAISAWQRRAQYLSGNIGFVDCHAIHHYHGPKSKRGYEWRWRVLRNHDFNPLTDLHRDACGVWQLTPDKPLLRDAIRAYFRSRDEDE